jgi:hypothetical protein
VGFSQKANHYAGEEDGDAQAEVECCGESGDRGGYEEALGREKGNCEEVALLPLRKEGDGSKGYRSTSTG